MNNLKNIKNILFDCDGVLYSDLEAVFGQVSKRMTKYISNKLNLDLVKAKELQRDYFHKYNTSLNGLMIHHDIPPEEFLEYVHDINLSSLKADNKLREILLMLPGEKYIFTNGTKKHAENVIKRLNLENIFQSIFGIKEANYLPKPNIETYNLFLKINNIDPKTSIMFEDNNLIGVSDFRSDDFLSIGLNKNE